MHVETFAAGLSDKILACRELGHYWRPFAVEYDAKAKSYERTLRCSRCRTQRHQFLSREGHVLSNRYTYSEGYLATDVEKWGASRDVFRLEAITRAVTEHAAPRAS